MGNIILIKIMILIISISPLIFLGSAGKLKKLERDTIAGMIALFIVCLSADFSDTPINIMSLTIGFAMGLLNKEGK